MLNLNANESTLLGYKNSVDHSNIVMPDCICWHFYLQIGGRPPYWILKFNFLLAGRLMDSLCVVMPNFVKIGRATAEIQQFFDFPTWRPLSLFREREIAMRREPCMID